MHDFFQRCQEMAAELNGEMISSSVAVVMLPLLHRGCIAGRINSLRVELLLIYAEAVGMQTTFCMH